MQPSIPRKGAVTATILSYAKTKFYRSKFLIIGLLARSLKTIIVADNND